MTDERFQKYFNHHETLSTLAEKYGIDRNTMREWIKPFKHKLSSGNWRTIRPHDLKVILECLGEYPLDEDLNTFSSQIK